MTALPQRLAGVVLTLGSVFMIDLNQINPLHQLWLPLMLAAGAYLMTQSIMAVAIACGHSHAHGLAHAPFSVVCAYS